MRKAIILAIFSFSTLVFFVACDKNAGNEELIDNCIGVAATFSGEVNPIIQTYCNQTACHDAGSTNGPGPLTNYTQVFAARGLIKDQVANGLMPQNTTLTNAQKLAIICWINNGAPNN